MEHGGPLCRTRKISSLAAPRHRAAAYRLDFADGRVLKGRELRDASTAARVRYVLRHAPHPAFPRLVAQRQDVMLLEWVEGSPAGPNESGVVRAGADFLATLHETPLPARCPFAPDDPLERQTARTARHLERLVRAGALDAGRADALRGVLKSHLPARWRVGFVHGDLCAENLVVDAEGHVRVVDNEALAVDACDADLARTLYRWSLDPRSADVFLETYVRRRSIEPLLEHFGYWALSARLGSAAHRVGAPRRVAAVPLRGLDRLQAAIESGLPGEEVLLRSLTDP